MKMYLLGGTVVIFGLMVLLSANVWGQNVSSTQNTTNQSSSNQSAHPVMNKTGEAVKSFAGGAAAVVSNMTGEIKGAFNQSK